MTTMPHTNEPIPTFEEVWATLNIVYYRNNYDGVITEEIID